MKKFYLLLILFIFSFNCFSNDSKLSTQLVGTWYLKYSDDRGVYLNLDRNGEMSIIETPSTHLSGTWKVVDNSLTLYNIKGKLFNSSEIINHSSPITDTLTLMTKKETIIKLKRLATIINQAYSPFLKDGTEWQKKLENKKAELHVPNFNYDQSKGREVWFEKDLNNPTNKKLIE